MEEVGRSPGPGAPVVTDLSGHGQARRLRRSPWSHTADGVNDRRHFSLQTRREECQSSRDRLIFTRSAAHASSREPSRSHLQKSNQARHH